MIGILPKNIFVQIDIIINSLMNKRHQDKRAFRNISSPSRSLRFLLSTQQFRMCQINEIKNNQDATNKNYEMHQEI